jgi:hypothetical protein
MNLKNGDDTQPLGPSPQGFLIYKADGFVSAQLMRPGRPAFHLSDWHHGTPEEYQASGSGYIAYCGTYEADEENATPCITGSRSSSCRRPQRHEPFGVEKNQM